MNAEPRPGELRPRRSPARRPRVRHILRVRGDSTLLEARLATVLWSLIATWLVITTVTVMIRGQRLDLLVQAACLVAVGSLAWTSFTVVRAKQPNRET